MVRFGFSRPPQGVATQARGQVAAAPQALADPSPVAPTSGEIISEIGLVLMLHLAFAVAVLLTLDAYGVT